MFTLLLPILFYVTGWWPQQNVAADASRDSGNLIISTDVELVVLDVSVKDPNGGYVSGLTAENFQVYEDKKPQQIKYFSHSDTPVTIGLIIDNSGSIYDAIGYSLQYLDKGHMDKKTLVVVSDGGDNASILSRKQIMERVEQSHITIYAIDIFDEDDRDSNSDVLKKLAQVSGGESFQLREIPETVTVCKKIAKDIRNRYTIAYVPSHVGSPSSVHLVKVNASTPAREKLIVRARTRYMIPDRPPSRLSSKVSGQ